MPRTYQLALLLGGLTTARPGASEAQTAEAPAETTYWTDVALGTSTCDNVTIKPGPTGIARLGADSLSLTHAGQTYRGSISKEGNFTTEPKELVFGTTVYTIGIRGRLLEKELAAEVTVAVRDSGSAGCRYTVHWTGRH